MRCVVTAVTAVTVVLAASAASANTRPSMSTGQHRESASTAAAPLKIEPAPEIAKVSAVYTPQVQARELAPSSNTTLADTDTDSGLRPSGSHSYGTMLATLMLMLVIAVRRYRTPGP